ncbi:linear amide C-N hydrolase [Corallococcus praedator]|uniref:Linear amide C-N hydrolase n=1 Tax=Corallococcus praedator TaxID=2316724 RepID=A0ABX9QRU0_9BACT|nr:MULTISPECIES: choloylglycine hydrolase family protein [Corallococcus]RKH36133.1 linear amide C-N hydrolase [Corallococcus sp. CA031C]RKI17030.1 linear amide C-N hydrolase [Corallococcus praedator]
MCTDFLITGTDSRISTNFAVNGRSMEFGVDLKSQIMVHAKGTPFQSKAPGLKTGLKWTSTYGFVGLTALSDAIIVDGMNTEGLSVGALWLPGSTYPAVTQPAQALALVDFVNWALGTCATVADVKAALTRGNVQVWEGDLLAKLLPLHFPIHDAAGNSVVVECTNGQLNIYDNPVGVCTNNPPFPQQLENLGNYANLSPWDAKPTELGLQSFSPAGHGSGMRGLPGDSTPPARFVRATYLKQYAQPVASSADANTLAFHLLNTVDIPLGTSRSVDKQGKDAVDYTQWAVVKDLTARTFSVRFYGNPCVYSVNLDTLDFSGASGKPFPVPATPTSIDLTASMSS